MKIRTLSIALASVAAAALIATGVVANGQVVGANMVATQVKAADRAEDFRLVDQNSKSHLLSYYKFASSVVIISHVNASSVLNDAVPQIKALQASLKANGGQLFFLNSTPGVTRESIIADMKGLDLNIPVLMDDTQLIGESLGVSRVGQALVINPKTWRVAYSGPIAANLAGKPTAERTDFAADAAAALANGKAVKTAFISLDTPALAFPNRDAKASHAKISYEKDISPILAKNCVACHSEGAIGPFAMDSYEKVKQWSGMMREAIRTDRMPPYNADPHVGSFAGDMNLPAKDQQTLIHWIEAGAPRGEGSDPLKINAKVAPEWELGTPDLIIELPAFKVPATGVVDYQNPVVMNPLTEGRWLRAATVKPSDRQAVHHLLSNGAGGYAVGAETTVYPKGTGTWVAPGQKFQFQMHYTPYGKETTEKTRVGLYFYPKEAPPEILRRSAVVLNAGIEIPPDTARHEEIAYITFPKNATLFTVFPHAHYRGESMAVSLMKPGSTKEELIVSLPKYDFNWQRGYDLATPIKIEPGTKLITRYVYDNSANNPANPDPKITVKWGEQSWEEMQYTALGFRWDDETVANRKDGYQKELENSRTIGMMDTNLDDKVAKSEVRGRMAKMLLENWDKVDANKDGYIAVSEMGPINQMMNGRIREAQAQQSVGQ
jgi:Copper type II ascorbate-dependent monooxygenase, C-terminal domain